MRKKIMTPLKTSTFDFGIFISMVLLILIGIAGIYSTGPHGTQYLKQAMWFFFGLILFFITLFFNYNFYLKYAEYIYFANILLLILTLLIGKNMRNTRGWIALGGVHLQTAEFMKISAIMMLAKYLSDNAGKLASLKDYLIPIFIILFPAFLILMQPDLGSALVLIPILVAMLYVSGMDDLYIILFLIISFLSIGLPLWMSYYQIMDPDSNFWLYRLFLDNTILLFIIFLLAFFIILLFLLFLVTQKKIYQQFGIIILVLELSLLFSVFLFHFLKLYHKKRLLVFINPNIDRLGAGYNLIQSKISIGAGKFLGRGFLHGSQTQFGFLPAQNTDFIFSTLAEQFGFILVSFIFLFFALIIKNIFGIIRISKDMFGSLVSTGIVTVFFFHILVNLGMCTGMLPVIGLPLPFLSYGGSSLLMFMFSMGVVMNIKRHRFVHL